MKKFSIILLLLVYNCSFAQSSARLKEKSNEIISEPIIEQIDTVASNFEEEFSSAEDKKNFKKLREYRLEKETLLEEEMSRLQYLKNESSKLEVDLDAVRIPFYKLKATIKLPGDTTVILKNYFVSVDEIYFWEVEVNLAEAYSEKDLVDTIYAKIEVVIKNISNKQAQYKDKMDFIKSNILNIRDDLNSCLLTIDNALTPEYAKQNFRKWVSGGFAVLVLIALLAWCVILYRAPDKKEIARTLISFSGLQFVTLFLIIISIILLGILGILEGRELAAILAGISGYILGKGIGTKGASPEEETGGESTENKKV